MWPVSHFREIAQRRAAFEQGNAVLPRFYVMEVLGRVSTTGYRVFCCCSRRLPRTQHHRPHAPMDVLRPTTWLLSLGLHVAILMAFVNFAHDTALESGSGGDMVNVEQGIALEGLTKLGEAEQVIETVDIPPVQEKVETPPVEQIKPELAEAITAKQSQHEVQNA